MKGMKWAQKAEFKAEMSEKRKELYQKFEPKIKAWFNEVNFQIFRRWKFLKIGVKMAPPPKL